MWASAPKCVSRVGSSFVAFGYCTLSRRFLPSGCREHFHVNLEEEDTGKRSKKRLDLAMRQLAWDRCDVLLVVRLHRV